MRSIVLEAFTVAVLGLGLSLLANQLSPRGLVLSRDYFRTGGASSSAAPVAHVSTNAVQSSPGASNAPASSGVAAAAEQALKAKGLQSITLQETRALYEDPRYRQSAYLFVDARNEQHYLDGHVPGAFQLDYYRPENHLPLVISMAQVAEKIVVYCNGGSCEDSELTALMLRDAGIPPEKLFVYIGGFVEWSGQGLPVETGVRDSGQIRSGGKP